MVPNGNELAGKSSSVFLNAGNFILSWMDRTVVYDISLSDVNSGPGEINIVSRIVRNGRKLLETDFLTP